jgi:accessory gene regulator B
MINRMSLAIAGYLKKSEPDNTPSIEVMTYSLYILLHATITTVLILFVAIIVNHFYETLIALLFFILLRIFGGGYHLHSSKLCTILSVVLICAAPFIPVSQKWCLIINIINIILILFFSPRNIKGYARISEKYYPIMKLITAIIAGSNFYWQNSTLLVVTFFYSMLLFPSQEGGENK